MLPAVDRLIEEGVIPQPASPYQIVVNPEFDRFLETAPERIMPLRDFAEGYLNYTPQESQELDEQSRTPFEQVIEGLQRGVSPVTDYNQWGHAMAMPQGIPMGHIEMQSDYTVITGDEE